MKPHHRLTALAALCAASLPSLPSLAHEGHGMPGAAHWHASDAVGWLLLAGLVVLAIWFSRGGK